VFVRYHENWNVHNVDVFLMVVVMMMVVMMVVMMMVVMMAVMVLHTLYHPMISATTTGKSCPC